MLGAANKVNVLPKTRVAEIYACLRRGWTIRPTAILCGVATNTVIRYRTRLIKERGQPKCPCGRPSSHRGWCKWRFNNSPGRQECLRRLGRLRTDYQSPIDEVRQLYFEVGIRNLVHAATPSQR